MDEVLEWLVTALADTLQADNCVIDPDVPLAEFGADSLVVATMLAQIEDELGVWVEPAYVPNGVTLRELADVVEQCRGAEEERHVA
jgi:acyl carrier protein